MLDRLKRVFSKNKKELQEIEEKKKGVEKFSERGIEDRKEILRDNNELLSRFDYYSSAYDKAVLARDERSKYVNQKQVSFLEGIIQRSSQGKFRDVISSYFGQVDKKIHNMLYDGKNRSSDIRWDRHCGRIIERYDNLTNYAISNGFATILLSTVSIFAGQVNFLPASTTSLISKVSIGLTIALATNCAAKIGSTLFNKKKYGGPLLEQSKMIFQGTYLENILNAKYALQRSKELTGEIVIRNSEPLVKIIQPSKVQPKKNTINLDEDLALDASLLNSDDEIDIPEIEKLVDEKGEEELVEPNINNYGNINFGHIIPDAKYQTKEGKLTYSQSISKARRVNVQDCSDDDYEAKIAAYDKLYNTFGKSKPRKKKSTDSGKALNDYNKTLKLLSEYGRKVHSGEATTQEYNTYMSLLFHLGKDDDFIATFLEDECDRYMADKAEYEKRLAKKIQ